jgi:putative endonuclease
MVAEAKKIITHEIGRQGEDMAANFFVAQGYAVIARNWKCRGGELDLVIRKGDEVRAIEVKTRRGPHQSELGPHEAVTDRKLARMGTAMGLFFATHPHLPMDAHMDVLAITLLPDHDPAIQWLKDFE